MARAQTGARPYADAVSRVRRRGSRRRRRAIYPGRSSAALWGPCADGPFPVQSRAAAPIAGEGTAWSPPPPPDSGTRVDPRSRVARFHKWTKRASNVHAAMRSALAPAAGSRRGPPGWSLTQCRRFSRRHLEERALRSAPLARDAEVFKAALRPHTAARSAVAKTHLHQVRLVDFFDGALLFV